MSPMPASKEPGAFLRTLLLHLDRAEHRQLHDRLARAERERKILRRAVILTIGLLLLSLAGMAYYAVLVPYSFRIPMHLCVRGLIALALGTVLSQIVFLIHLLRLQASMARLHEEGRRLILLVTLRRPEQPELAPAAWPLSAR